MKCGVMKARFHPAGGGALGIMLNHFVKDGFFVREGNGFVLAPGVKVSEREMSVV